MLIKFPRTNLETLSSVPWLHWGTLVFWGAGLFLCVLLGLNRSLAFEASVARQWPTAEGTVLSTDSHKKRVCGSGKNSNKCHDEYWADVLYEYDVDGTKHRAQVVNFTEAGRPKSEVDAALAKYPVGSEVLVHYDPANPQHAYLEIDGPERLDGAFLSLAVAVGAAILSGFVFNLLWRRHAREVIDIARGPKGTERLERALPEDWNREASAPGTGYRQAAPRPPGKEEVEREFEASVARLVPAAKAGAWVFLIGLFLCFAWAVFTVVVNPGHGILVGGSVAAGVIFVASLLTGAALTARPIQRRLAGLGRVTFEATWGQVVLALIPLLGFIMALEHISRLRRGQLQVGEHHGKPERYGPERGPNLLFFIALAMLWPMVGIVMGVGALVSRPMPPWR